MKRSEMLEYMVEEWKDYCKTMGPDEASVGKGMANLLDMMEGFGMLPPTIRVLEDHYNRQMGEMGFDSNEWEAE